MDDDLCGVGKYMKLKKQISLFLLLLLFLFGCSKQSFHEDEVTYLEPVSESIHKETITIIPKNRISEEQEAHPLSDAEEKQIHHTGITPVKLSIPAIQVETEVVSLGLLDNGQMDDPKDDTVAGWFEPGFKPGEVGNAVIAGHRDNYTGPALFFDLKKLKPGDIILVTDSLGRQLTFVVSLLKTYERESSPLEEIFGTASKPQLNLITCAGKYDRRIHESEKRLVVYSELLENE
jgi:sortase A